MTLQYQASIFPSPRGAAAAYGDGRASLWEIGHAVRIAHLPGTAFDIRERNHVQVDVVLHRSIVEIELRLRYPTTMRGEAVNAGIRALQHTNKIAAGLVARVTATLPPTAAQTDNIPPIYVGPVGTGPIVKSPSLMTMEGSSTNPAIPSDPGAFRSAWSPSLADRARRATVLVPAGGLARYVRTVTDGLDRIEWYDSSALYGNTYSARQAFDALILANASHRPVGVATLLAGADRVTTWQVRDEVVLVVQSDNLITVVAGTPARRDNALALARRLLTLMPTWLHTVGTSMVDATGQSVHLSALNWYGAEQQDFVVGGLDYQPYGTILQTIKRLGYNSIRLPFSDQLVQQNPIITSHVQANPELAGLHALDIMDRIIGYAGALGISVILDNHRSEAGWSSQPSGLWYTSQYSDAVFDRDWSTLATRYAATNAVVGADLRNEPHATASWGDGNTTTDWHAAAERAGNAVLAANPHLLVIVEGIQLYAGAPSAWWGANLMGVATAPVVLRFANGATARTQLVYSAHDYGPEMCGGGCPWFNTSATYESLSRVWDQYWGYIAADPTKSYAAPVWIGEFGTCNGQKACGVGTAPGSQGQWFSSLVRYLGERRLSWAYWSANGTQSTGGQRTYGDLDWYGLLERNWSTPVPWLRDALQSIQLVSGRDQSPQRPRRSAPRVIAPKAI